MLPKGSERKRLPSGNGAVRTRAYASIAVSLLRGASCLEEGTCPEPHEEIRDSLADVERVIRVQSRAAANRKVHKLEAIPKFCSVLRSSLFRLLRRPPTTAASTTGCEPAI
jgi:hypothetical protein